MTDVTTRTFSLPFVLAALIAIWFISRTTFAPRLPWIRKSPKSREVSLSLGLVVLSVVGSWLSYTIVPDTVWYVFHRPDETFRILSSVFLDYAPVLVILPWLEGGLKSIRFGRTNLAYSLLLGVLASLILVIPTSLVEPSFLQKLLRVYWPFVLSIVIAAFGEELLYRGLLQTRLEGFLDGWGFGFWPGLLLTAVIFNLAHTPSLILVFHFKLFDVMGFSVIDLPSSILLGYIAQRSNSILGSTFYHFCFNLPILVLTCLPVYCLV